LFASFCNQLPLADRLEHLTSFGELSHAVARIKLIRNPADPKDDPAWSRGEEEDRTKFQH